MEWTPSDPDNEPLFEADYDHDSAAESWAADDASWLDRIEDVDRGDEDPRVRGLGQPPFHRPVPSVDGGGPHGSGGGVGRFGSPFEDHDDDYPIQHHWSVPWSDLMMVMFILFAVMAAVRVGPTADGEEPLPTALVRERPVGPPTEPLMTINVLERTREAVRDAEVDDVEIILMEDRSVRVSVQGPMLFGLGSAELRPEVATFLDGLGRVIQATPFRIEVTGHTDDYPISSPQYPSNWELSTARASRVVRYLVDRAGIDPTRFTVVGRSQYEPVRPNSSDINRSSNRRVEILITRDVMPVTQTANP